MSRSRRRIAEPGAAVVYIRVSTTRHADSGAGLDAHRATVAAGCHSRGLVVSDLGVDTLTPAGEAMANATATSGQLERRMVGQRTARRAGVASRRPADVRPGRPGALSEEVVDRIVGEHTCGESRSAISGGLEADCIPTARGGARWYSSTVREVWYRQDAAALRSGSTT